MRNDRILQYLPFVDTICDNLYLNVETLDIRRYIFKFEKKWCQLNIYLKKSYHFREKILSTIGFSISIFQLFMNLVTNTNEDHTV